MTCLKSIVIGLLVLLSCSVSAQQTTSLNPNPYRIQLSGFPVPKPTSLAMPSVVEFSPYGSGFPTMRRPVVPSPSASRPTMGITDRARQQMQLLQQRRELLRQQAHNTYSFPEVPEEVAATKPYRQAYQHLQAMLKGNRKLSLADAVFSVENAFYEGQLLRQAFDDALAHYAKLSLGWLQSQGLDASSSTARLY